MAHDHVIAEGDHIVRLAYGQGMRDPMLIWADAANEALRAKRADPGVLAVGDTVHVPDGPVWVFDDLHTGQEHTVVVDLAVGRLRVRLRHPSDAARAGKPASVLVDGEEKLLATESDGLLEIEIGPFTREVAVSIDGRDYVLEVARLAPPDTLDGVRARLANLGYAPGPLTGKADDYLLRSAVEEFQHDHGSGVDGIPGPKTQQLLAEAHGA